MVAVRCESAIPISCSLFENDKTHAVCIIRLNCPREPVPARFEIYTIALIVVLDGSNKPLNWRILRYEENDFFAYTEDVRRSNKFNRATAKAEMIMK